jgi:hypothetical protein
MSDFIIDTFREEHTRVLERQLREHSQGYKGILLREIERRNKLNMDSRIIIEGEAGLGKSYAALRLAELIDSTFIDDPEKAVEHQVVFAASEYMDAVTSLPKFSCLIYDEPGQSWHHRQFMSEANIILSKTMIGYRFKRFVTFLCIPSLGLLDKDAKTLVSFLINITAHGKGEVFKQIPDKFGSTPWFKTIVDVQHFTLPGEALLKAYEAKKQRVQDQLYLSYSKRLKAGERTMKSNSDIMDEVLKTPEKYQQRGVYSISALMGSFDIGRDRARGIRAKLDQKTSGESDVAS